MSFNRVLRPPKDSFFLWGCRGAGKSTWLRQHFESATWVDLLDEEFYQQLLVNPKLFPARLRAVEPGSWVVVDEVQRLPNLLNEVHRAIEQWKLKFVLCGSSARKLKRAGVNLLGGRASSCYMHPFLPEELGCAFDVDLALMHGALPLVWDSADRTARLRAYGQLYLKEEIKAEALVRNLPGFARFMQIAAMFHGQVINVSGLARDAGVARTTVEGYLDVLEDTLLTFRVPAYEARLRVKERRHPKLYWTDPGLVRSAKGYFGSLQAEERGALFEGMVAQYLRAACDYYGAADSVHYWSPPGSGETEVDFLVRRGDQFVAIEVKSGSHFFETWTKGLKAVASLPGLTRRLIVTPNLGPLVTADGIEVVSFVQLAQLARTDKLFQ